MEDPLYEYTRLSDIPPKDEPNLLDSSVNIEELMSEHVGFLGSVSNQTMTAMIPFIRGYYARASNSADEVIFTQALSDFSSLFIELSRGLGRSAFRSARSLVEGSINIRWVLSNPVEASKYLDQMKLMPLLEDELARAYKWPTKAIARKMQSRAAHSLKKDSVKIDALLVKYGSKFKSKWTQLNLSDRADRVGLDYLYSTYRVLSLVSHGASAGIIGLRREIEGQPVVRTGSDVSLCSMSYLFGIQAMSEILADVGPTRPGLDLSPAVASMRCAISFWDEFDAGMRRVDNKIWPEQLPMHVVAVLAVSLSGAQRWYWYDPTIGVLIEADEPNLSEKDARTVDKITAQVVSSGERFIQRTQQYATTFFEHIVVNSRPGAPMLPATAILIDPSEVRRSESGPAGGHS